MDGELTIQTKICPKWKPRFTKVTQIGTFYSCVTMTIYKGGTFKEWNGDAHSVISLKDQSQEKLKFDKMKLLTKK